MSKINLPELPALSSNEINEACWKFIDAMPHELSGPVFNELKPALYAAICPALQAYAEQAVREALVHAFNELNDLFLETLMARISGEDLDNNDEQFNIGMCAQALGISRCQHVVQSLIRPQDPQCSPTSSTGQPQ